MSIRWDISQEELAAQSADAVLPLVEAVLPRLGSAVGFGQEALPWLAALKERGVKTTLAASLTTTESGRYDLAVCLETAGSLPEEEARQCVETLVGASDFLLFSAPIPFQQGALITNGQWLDYWNFLFNEQGFVAVDFLRKALWEEPNVAPEYKQNMLLFVKQEAVEFLKIPDLERVLCLEMQPMVMVHPDMYMDQIAGGTAGVDVARREKYRKYRTIGFGEGMQPFVELVQGVTTVEVKNIFEIGANFAQDADYLHDAFGVSADQVYVFEAHPDIFAAIQEIHHPPFNAFHAAVFNENKSLTFNVVPLSSTNTGLSSVFAVPGAVATQPVTVQAIRMDDFLAEHHIDTVDFLKLDVEGATYEVLQGFGDRLKDIQTMHIEAEHTANVYGVNHLFDDIAALLRSADFEMVFFQRVGYQSDSFWVKKSVYRF